MVDGADPAGAEEHGVHVYPFRVYYEDTDAGGIVYYANYLRFAERARTEMLRDLGFARSGMMEKEGLSFAVRRCVADYLKPAKLDDALEVHTEVSSVGHASLDAAQTVRRQGADIARLDIRLACLDETGRAARMPPKLRAALQEFSDLGKRGI